MQAPNERIASVVCIKAHIQDEKQYACKGETKVCSVPRMFPFLKVSCNMQPNMTTRERALEAKRELHPIHKVLIVDANAVCCLLPPCTMCNGYRVQMLLHSVFQTAGFLSNGSIVVIV